MGWVNHKEMKNIAKQEKLNIFKMQDLDHSFHSPKYGLAISHGDPIQGTGSSRTCI